MVAPVRPAYTKLFQAEKVVWVPTVASITAPAATEANATAGIDISCYVYDDIPRPTQNTNRVTFARRLCDGAVYEGIGTTNYTGGDLQYAYNPQAPANDPQKAVSVKLPNGTTGFLIWRLGINVNTDFATGQFVNVIPVAWGPQMPVPHGDGESAEVAIMQSYAVTAPPAFNVALT